MSEPEYLKRISEKLETLIDLLSKNEASTRIEVENGPRLYAYLDEWLNEVKAPTITPKSLKILRNGVERYIKPAVSDKPLSAVRSSEIMKAVDGCPYSYMRQVVYSIFRAVFKRAHQYDLIAENPTDKLDYVKHHRKRGKALTIDEQAAFLKAIENEPTRPLWLFYLLSGCRCQEALSLSWTDIDEKAQRVYIRGTKTENAERYIPLFSKLVELFSSLPRTSEKVFPYTVRQVDWHFHRILRKNGMKFRLHGLRHTFATRCLESGITAKTVAKWLGHKHIQTTLKVYSHVQTEFERQEAKRFNPRID